VWKRDARRGIRKEKNNTGTIIYPWGKREKNTANVVERKWGK
jgi:hypothetical protein